MKSRTKKPHRPNKATAPITMPAMAATPRLKPALEEEAAGLGRRGAALGDFVGDCRASEKHSIELSQF